MADHFGPASDLATTTRPAYAPALARTGAATYFQRCSSEGADDGTMIDAEWANLIVANLEAVRVAAGTGGTPGADGTLRDAILALIGQSAIHVGVDTGAVNALSCAVAPAVTAWGNWQIFGITPGHTTTSTTPTLAVSGLAAKAIVNPDGSPLAIGALVAGAKALMAYDSVLDKVVLLTPARIGGQIGVMTLAAPQSLSNATTTKINLGGIVPFGTIAAGVLTITRAGTYTIAVDMSSEANTASGNVGYAPSVYKNGAQYALSVGSVVHGGYGTSENTVTAVLEAAVGDTIAVYGWIGRVGGSVTGISVTACTATILRHS